jgi:MFS family permease
VGAQAFPIRRNTLLLAASLTALSGMIQLAVAVGTITLVLVTGVEGILGLGPAIFLATGALAALPAGRAMDRFGRMPVIRAGFLTGIAASLVTALGCHWRSSGLVVVGFALVGAAQGSILLARAAASDMYPTERRGRGISLVLFGAVFGAALGPLVWRPLFADRHHLDAAGLVVPWLVAGGVMAVGLLIALAVRPDPRTIGEALGYSSVRLAPAEETAPLAEILRRPGVLPALVAAVASFAVMVAVMNLSGYMVVGHGHSQADTFWVISAHIVGMYGLVLVVGDLIDRLGRRFALAGGLAVMAASCIALAWIESVLAMSVALFGLGLGWVFSYVAATSELVDLSALSERGRLVGFSDLASGLTGSALALIGGAAYSGLGADAVAYGATAAVALPAFLLVLARRRPAQALEPAA